uniref:Putative trypsin-like serine protease n=1 Tax=Lutzomyia longipalpis TaxID=7200 RepID=A0A7G3AWM0_LUTLO
MWIIALLCGFYAPSVLGQGCNYAQQVNTTPVAIFSPNYPGNYPANSQCTWTATAFSDYQIKLTCTVVQIPTGTSGCPRDYIIVSRTGRTDFADGTRYCGTQAFTVTSTSNQMRVGLFAQPTSPGGRFYCTIQAVFNSCNCGRRKSTRIVGGQNAAVNEFPMVAALVDLTTRDLFCGATLISNRKAITAQHCLLNQSPGNVALLVGDYDITTGSDTPYSALYSIQTFTCYTSCSATPSNETDIALVTTTNEIQMNPGVGIACLPIKYQGNTFAGSTVEVSGWGHLDFGGPDAKIQQKTRLNVISQTDCQNRFGTSLIVRSTQMCTFTPGTDTCQKDSGEGLLYTGPDNGRLYTIGVVASGVECGTNNPSINTRVTLFINWIITNSPEIQYCNI